MNLTLHIIKKDIVRLKWFIALWVLVLVVYGVGAYLTADMSLKHWWELSKAVSNFEWILIAMIFLIPSLVLHSEPLVGNNSDWLTRPIPRKSLLFAKCTLFVGVILLLVVTVVVVLAAQDLLFANVVTGKILYSPLFSRALIVVLAVSLLIASVTSSLQSYLISTVSACMIYLFGEILFAILTGTLHVEETRPSDLSLLLQMVGSVGILVCLLIWQFLRRKPICISICAGILFFITPILSEFVNRATPFQANEVKVHESIISESEASFSVVSPKISRAYENDAGVSTRSIKAEFRLEHVPAAIHLGYVRGQTELSQEGLNKLTTETHFWYDLNEEGEISANLPNLRFLNYDNGEDKPLSRRDELVHFRDANMNTYQGKLSKLKTSLHVDASRPKVIAEIPLRQGCVWKEMRKMIYISRLDVEVDKVSLRLRTRDVLSYLRFLVVNQTQGQALFIRRNSIDLAFPRLLGSTGLSERSLSTSKRKNETWHLTREWLKDAKLYVITYENLGYIERSYSDDNFVVTEVEDEPLM